MSTNRSTQKLQRRALRKKKGASVFQYFLLILGTVVILLPMYLTVVTAFKSPEESARNFFAPPTSLYLDNIISVVNKANFFYYIRNSFVITLFSLLGIILIVPLVSYSLARNLNHIYFKAVYYLFILGAFVPFTILMVPQIKLMSILGMLNNFGLILLYWVYSLSEGTLLTVSFVQSGIPYELEESAYMDGATRLQNLRYIIIPHVKSTIYTNTMLITLMTLGVFGLIYTLTGGGPNGATQTMPIYMYIQAFKSFQLGYGSAISVVLLMLGIALSVLYTRIARNK